jgi:hypothetical protein
MYVKLLIIAFRRPVGVQIKFIFVGVKFFNLLSERVSYETSTSIYWFLQDTGIY